jgi:hypothetical protein
MAVTGDFSFSTKLVSMPRILKLISILITLPPGKITLFLHYVYKGIPLYTPLPN